MYKINRQDSSENLVNSELLSDYSPPYVTIEDERTGVKRMLEINKDDTIHLYASPPILYIVSYSKLNLKLTMVKENLLTGAIHKIFKEDETIKLLEILETKGVKALVHALISPLSY